MTLVPLSRLLPCGRADDTPIVLRAGVPQPFARFRADVARIADRVRTDRIGRALLVAEDSYLFAVGLFGLLQADAEIILPPNAQPGSVESLLSGADTLVTDRAGPNTGILLTSGGDDAGDRLRAIDPDRPRIKFYTSGSTGARKCVDKTIGQLEREIILLEGLWGDALGAARVHGTVSHQHIYGLTFRVLWPLMAGRVFTADSHQLWETLLAELDPPAAIVTSPAHLSRLGSVAALPWERRPSLVITAGAELSLQAAQETLSVLGCQPTEIFGSTETGAIAHRLQERPETPWQMLPCVEVAAERGELAVRGPHLDGTIRTSDQIEMVGPDRFHFRGRSDRIVKIEGKRVSLPEVERDLVRLPWLDAAAVLPWLGDRTSLAAVATLTDAGRTALAELGKFRFERLLRRALAATQDDAALPRRWRFVESLPVDAMGKHPRAMLDAVVAAPDHG